MALLTLLRCTADASGAQREQWWTEPVIGIATFISLPFVYCLIPVGSYSGDPMSEAVTGAIVIGLNAFAWGYGLAALIGGVRKWIAVLRPRDRAGGDAAKTSG
jgi:hypothetical protein